MDALALVQFNLEKTFKNVCARPEMYATNSGELALVLFSLCNIWYCSFDPALWHERTSEYRRVYMIVVAKGFSTHNTSRTYEDCIKDYTNLWNALCPCLESHDST